MVPPFLQDAPFLLGQEDLLIGREDPPLLINLEKPPPLLTVLEEVPLLHQLILIGRVEMRGWTIGRKAEMAHRRLAKKPLLGRRGGS